MRTKPSFALFLKQQQICNMFNIALLPHIMRDRIAQIGLNASAFNHAPIRRIVLRNRHL